MENLSRTTRTPSGDGSQITIPRVRLAVETGPERGREVRLRGQPVVLGRSVEVDLIVEDEKVSRRHAVVEPSEGGWYLRDLESKGGTFLNGDSVEIEELSDGDQIRIGDTELRFHAGTEAIHAPRHADSEFEGLIGESAVMRRLFGLLARVGGLELPVLLVGEPGTGKKALAHALHAHGAKPDAPYQAVDCSGHSPEALRRELFGRTGAFAKASGGTLFLDEVAALPEAIQREVLRVLEEGELVPEGDAPGASVRVRVIASTRHSLPDLVAAEAFRPDLYYRFASVVVSVPSLRTRQGDIPRLAQHFLAPGCSLDEAAQAALEACPWPENVRQLRDILVRACELSGDRALRLADLGPLPAPGEAPPAVPPRPTRPPDPAPSRAEQEKALLAEALSRCQGNRRQTAEFLGLGRTSLFRKMKKYGLL